jgi:hypothetical protein
LKSLLNVEPHALLLSKQFAVCIVESSCSLIRLGCDVGERLGQEFEGTLFDYLETRVAAANRDKAADYIGNIVLPRLPHISDLFPSFDRGVVGSESAVVKRDSVDDYRLEETWRCRGRSCSLQNSCSSSGEVWAI